MAIFLAALVSGLIFGLGLIISQMVNPAKVLGFLDVFGAWDPSLAFVMATAIPVASVGFAITGRRTRSILGEAVKLPTKTSLDRRLIGGAVVFGVGWGLVGFCPGPAMTALGFGRADAAIFVVAMIVGMILFEIVESMGRRQLPA
jgi:uncharacterized protein